MSFGSLLEGFLKGVSSALFLVYLLSSPLLLEDELRRLPSDLNVGRVLVFALTLLKTVYGVIHLSLAFNSEIRDSVQNSAPMREVVKLLMACFVFEAFLKYSDFADNKSFAELYKDSGYVMTIVASESKINNPSLQFYLWTLTVACIAAVGLHSAIDELFRVGRLCFVVFLLMFGVGSVVFEDFSRCVLSLFPELFTLSAESDATHHQTATFALRIVFALAFLTVASGLAMLRLDIDGLKPKALNTAYFGSLVAMVALSPAVLYEVTAMKDAVFYTQLRSSALFTSSGRMQQKAAFEMENVLFPLPCHFQRLLTWLFAVSGLIAMNLRFSKMSAELATAGHGSAIEHFADATDSAQKKDA